MVSVLAVNYLSLHKSVQLFSIPPWFLLSSPLHWFLIGFRTWLVRLTTDLICSPACLFKMFSPMHLKIDISRPQISAANTSSSPLRVRALCKTPFAGRQLQRCAHSQHHSLPLPMQPQALCGGSFAAAAPRAPLCCSRSSVPGNVEVFILRGYCQRSSLIANGLESASSFPSDHILLFINAEQTYLVSIYIFPPHFHFFFQFQPRRKVYITATIDFSLNISTC